MLRNKVILLNIAHQILQLNTIKETKHKTEAYKNQYIQNNINSKQYRVFDNLVLSHLSKQHE